MDIDEKELWGLLGFRDRSKDDNYPKGALPIVYPDGSVDLDYPDIHDLNALFKWAVPALARKFRECGDIGYAMAKLNVWLIGWASEITFMENIDDKNAAQALAKACYKALKGVNNG